MKCVRWLLSMLVAGILIGALPAVGCGETSTNTTKKPTTTTTQKSVVFLDSTTAKTTTTSEASGPRVEKWGTTVELPGLTVTVDAPVDDTGNLSDAELTFVDKGNKVMYMIVTIKNTGNESYSYNPLAFTLSDSEGFQYDSLGVMCSRPTLDTGELPPGRSVKGALAFEMPKKSHPSYVDFVPGFIGSIAATWGD